MDWFLGAKEAVFKCSVVPGTAFDVKKFSENLLFMSAEEISYNVIYKSTLLFHFEEEHRLSEKVLLLDRKDKARPDEFESYLRRNIPKVIDFQEVASENHNLLQVVDLLVGCVNGDLNGVQKYGKRAVIDHLKARLMISGFRDRNHYTKEKFRVAFWTGKKTSVPTKTEGPTSA